MDIEINPLNVFDLRRVENFCPPHFTVIKLKLNNELRIINNWIYENLRGRYYLDYDKTQPAGYCVIGFELPEEAMLCGLQIDVVNR